MKKRPTVAIVFFCILSTIVTNVVFLLTRPFYIVNLNSKIKLCGHELPLFYYIHCGREYSTLAVFTRIVPINNVNCNYTRIAGYIII